MDSADLDTDCLAHLEAHDRLEAYCRRCRHRASLHIERLREQLGENFRLRKLRERLRCERCGDRKQIVLSLRRDG